MSFSEDLLSALSEIVNDTKWHNVGKCADLKASRVTKLYPDIEEDDDMVIQPDDIALFYIEEEEKFYAMDCSCPHEGGPLDVGDIEDLDGALSVICPWHSYDFDLRTGESSTGLKTSVYEIKVVGGAVYIQCDHKLSTSKQNDQISNGNNTNSQVSSTCVDAPSENKSVSALAKLILNTSDPAKKVELTRSAFEKWKAGEICEIGQAIMPDEPKRQDDLETKEPGQIKRGKGGTLKTRIALLHSLANIEQWAIDLAWDIMGRFGQFKINNTLPLPTEFFTDFMKVADDEAKHFTLINKRLAELGSFFGALPVHNGLWQSAQETSEDILARLAILHMVHEARGLDVQPKTAQRFLSQNDKQSGELMDVIYNDEITHVACGMKWFTYICKNTQPSLDPVSTFHTLVKKHFKGYLKPPFNTSGRSIAGMGEEWYTPLVKPH